MVGPFLKQYDPSNEKQIDFITLDVLTFEDDCSSVITWCHERGLHVKSSENLVRIEVSPNTLQETSQNLCDLAPIRLVMEYIPPERCCFNAKIELGITIGDPPARHCLERGEGQIIGIADTYLDIDHPDFAGRIVDVQNLWGSSVNHHHGTMVAGCALGNGKLNPNYEGVAPLSRLFFQSIARIDGEVKLEVPNDVKLLFETPYQQSVRIHNNSWEIKPILPYPVCAYITLSWKVDEFASFHQDMLIVAAAGNITKDHPHPIIGFPGSCKNVLTVGASNGDSVADYSCQGVSSDRIKPDLVAPGSVTATAYGNYGQDSGTSYACAFVSGCAALVREYYVNSFKYYNPSAALVKATLINGATPLPSPSSVPNGDQGYGKVDMKRTIPSPGCPFSLTFFDRQPMVPGSGWSASISIPKLTPIHICLCWTDTLAGPKVNNVLSLVVAKNGVDEHWNTSDGNNVKKISFEGVGNLDICVVASGIMSISPYQTFALVITSDFGCIATRN